MPTKEGYDWLKKEEGFTPRATHLKTQGGGREKVRTIGHGYNIDAQTDPKGDFIRAGIPEKDIPLLLSGKMKITKDQAEALFRVSVERAAKEAATVIPNYGKLPPPVRDAMVSMAYQLGATGLSKFDKMKSALVEEDYQTVAKEIMNSKMARVNSTARSQRTAKMILDYAATLPKAPPKKSSLSVAMEAYEGKMRERISKVYSQKLFMDRLTEKYVQMQLFEKEKKAKEADAKGSTPEVDTKKTDTSKQEQPEPVKQQDTKVEENKDA